jgi:hypothetical protein
MPTLTYEQSAELMKDPIFLGRVKVACLRYADFIMIEPSNTAAHSTRYRWAQNTFNNPEVSATQVISPTVMDNQVQTDGAAITDTALQTTVETVVNKML